MDEEIFRKVVTEVFNFYLAITTPFLNRMPDNNDRGNAVLWSQKIMDLKDHDSLTKYLTYLTFMIINGRLVTPFETDPRTSEIPPLPVHVGETEMLNFIEKAVQINNEQPHSSNAELSAAVSNDELAFISTQPVPGVGVRMYLATSAQPFAMWSKADGAPHVVKYDVPAREVIDRGLAVAKEKFYSYLDEMEKLNKQNGTRSSGTKFAQSGNVPVTNGDISTSDVDRTADSSFDFGSSNDTLNRSGARDPGQAQQGVSRGSRSNSCSSNCTSIGQNAVPGTSGVTTITTTLPPIVGKYSSYRPRPAEPLNDEDKRRESEIDGKYERWFGESQYNSYREVIKGFLRSGTRIDSIRRAVHSHMRELHNPNPGLPLYAYDSEDESVPYEVRILHLRERYADVLQREYGIVDEAELYYLLGLTGLSERNMEKARELIKYAEEGIIDEDFRKKFLAVQGRTCGRLLTIIEELLQEARRSAATPHRSALGPQQQSTSSRQIPSSTHVRQSASTQHSGRRMRSMPTTTYMDEAPDDPLELSRGSNQSNIENEPEPEFFRNIEHFDESTNGTTEQSNLTNNSTRGSAKQNQSEEKPSDSGRVYSECPRENCDD